MDYIGFPYTNAHNVNLDWILDKVAELEARVTELEARVTALEQEASNNE